MQRMSLHFRGPIRRPLWNRLRRRLVQTSSAGVISTTLAGGALYVASAAEPNLSGVWVHEDGTELRLFHTGARVTAIFERALMPTEDDVSFVANFSSKSKLKGYIYLIWVDEEMREACGHEAFADHTFEASVDQNYMAMEYKWTQTWANQETCAPTSSQVRTNSLRRKTN